MYGVGGKRSRLIVWMEVSIWFCFLIGLGVLILWELLVIKVVYVFYCFVDGELDRWIEREKVMVDRLYVVVFIFMRKVLRWRCGVSCCVKVVCKWW